MIDGICSVSNIFIAIEMNGLPWCAKSYHDCRSLSVGGTISFRQMRWAFAQGTISLRRLPTPPCRRDNFISANAMTVCARDNLIIAVAIATLRKEQTHFRTCETLCAVNNFIFAVAIAVLRKKQSSFRKLQVLFARFSNHGSQSRKSHWRPVYKCSPFASSSLMVKQLRKPWCENTGVSAS